MTTTGLTPDKTLTLYGKTIDALFAATAVPDAVVDGHVVKKTVSGSKAAEYFDGNLVAISGYRFGDEDAPVRLPDPVILLLGGAPLAAIRRRRSSRRSGICAGRSIWRRPRSSSISARRISPGR